MFGDEGSSTRTPTLADSQAPSRVSLAGEDDWLEGTRIVEESTASFAVRGDSFDASPEPMLAARTDSRERAYEAALAALDATPYKAPAQSAKAEPDVRSAARVPAPVETVSAPIEGAPELADAVRSEAPETAAPARKSTPKAIVVAKKDAPKVAAASKKDKDAAKVAATSKRDAAKVAASAKKEAPKVVAAGKKDGAKVVAAGKKDATKVAATAKKDAPKVAGQGVYLQVGAFGDRSNAERLRKKLSPHVAGQVRVQSPGSSGSSLYKVKVGPFGSEGEARKASAKLASLGVGESRRVVN
jgi:cell division protein FtsN